MKVNLLYLVLLVSIQVLFGCLSQKPDDFVIEGIHYFWHPTNPRTNSYISIIAREYFKIDKNGYCQGIIEIDSKELIVKCMIEKSILTKMRAAVSTLKSDTIIFSGNMDDPSIRKLVITEGNTKRRITFSMYESNEFADFYTLVHSCLFVNRNVLHQSEELLTDKKALMRSILRNPYQDGFYNFFLQRWPNIKVDSTLN